MISENPQKNKSKPLATVKQIEAIRKLPPHQKKYPAGDGLYLSVRKNGGMYWHWKVRFPKETIVSYGTYPEVSLQDARERHREAKTQASQGIHPNAAKRQKRLDVKSQENFDDLARDLHKTKAKEWSASYASRWLRRLEKHVFPHFKGVPIGKIRGNELLAVMRKIAERGTKETAHRALKSCNQVFDFAVALGTLTYSPFRKLSEGLPKSPRRHMAALLDPLKIGEFLTRADEYPGTCVVRAALQLTPMLLVRPGELRAAAWSEFDLKTGLWTIPAQRMKRDKHGKEFGAPHLVQLPRQAISILENLRHATGPEGLVFKGEQDHSKSISENTVNAAIRRLGYCTKSEVTAHGFRATARTLIEEDLQVPAFVIELQLAHTVKDSLGTAYNRTEHLLKRAEMLQRWADYLDRLKMGKAPSDFGHLRLAAA